MITVTVARYRLRVEGHAGYDEEGKDIVCAAASILFYTLARALQEMESKGELQRFFCRSSKGKAFVGCLPRSDCEQSTALLFETIESGYQLLQEQYKEYLQVSKAGG